MLILLIAKVDIQKKSDEGKSPKKIVTAITMGTNQNIARSLFQVSRRIFIPCFIPVVIQSTCHIP